MKKVFFVTIAIMVLCVSVALTVKSFSGRDYVLDANVEALSGIEIPTIPCVLSEDTCRTLAYDANGQLGMLTIPGMKNVN